MRGSQTPALSGRRQAVSFVSYSPQSSMSKCPMINVQCTISHTESPKDPKIQRPAGNWSLAHWTLGILLLERMRMRSGAPDELEPCFVESITGRQQDVGRPVAVLELQAQDR